MAKKTFNKLTVLDECTDGNYDKFKELIAESFDYFDKMYSVCKEMIGPSNIDKIGYDGLADDCAKFSIHINKDIDISEKMDCVTTDDDSESIPKSYIEVEKADNMVSLNIFINGGEI